MNISDLEAFGDLMEIRFDEGSFIAQQCCQDNERFLTEVFDEDEEIVFDTLCEEEYDYGNYTEFDFA